MDEQKFVTLEALERYDELLKAYIKMRDELMLDGITTCPKCGAIITSEKCENCAK